MTKAILPKSFSNIVENKTICRKKVLMAQLSVNAKQVKISIE